VAVLTLICKVAVFTQDKCPINTALKLSPTWNPFAGTVNVPTPVPNIVVSTVVAVTGVESAV
jgi:hypothetical protein